MKNNIEELLMFLKKLKDARIHYSLENNRYDAVSVNVAVPGERWEIDFLSDDTVEIEIFKSDGTIYDGSLIAELFRKFSD